MIRLVFFGCLLALGASAIPQQRIVGGKLAEEGQFPWSASLRGQYNWINFCAGSIIGKYWILTAASCVIDKGPNQLHVTVGSNKLSNIVQKHDVYDIYTKEYNSNGWLNDIALIKLKTPIQFNDKVKPIPLSAETIGAGVDVTFAGWGWLKFFIDRASDLYYLNAKTVGHEECQDAHSPQGTVNEEQHLCVLAGIKHGACYEDGGAALVHNGKQVGIFSWLRPCAAAYPDVFTRIPPHLNWIKEITGITAE